MTRKELIRLAREAGLDIPDDNPAYNLEFNLEELGVFVELVKEQQQSWIASLEQNARDADKLYKELETELAEQQAREIEHHKDWVAHQTTRLDEAEKLIEQLREGLRKAAYMVRENTITPGGNPFALQEIEALAAAKQWKEK